MLTRNSKLKKSPGFYDWSIRAIMSCPGADTCKKYCYARKGTYSWTNTIEAQVKKFKATRRDDFVGLMDIDIKKKRKIKAVRIHSAGDMHSQLYLDKWTKLAALNPDILFYCYSKSLHLDWTSFIDMPNTKMIQSIGGRFDAMIDMTKAHAKIFPDLESLEAEGYTDCSEYDHIASQSNVIKIGLIAH